MYFKLKENKTILYNKLHHGPLMVQRIFHHEKNVCHVYLLHPPGGVVSGDSLFINAKFSLGSKVLITSPGATKFYKSIGKTSYVNQNFYLSENSSLEWLPQDNIIFCNSDIQLNTQFYLKKTSKLFAWENLHFKDYKNKKSFGHTSLVTCLQIWKDKKLLLHERLRVLKGDMTILDFHPLVTIIVASPANEHLLYLARQTVKNQKIIAGCTLIDHLLIIRLLDKSNINVQNILRQLWHVLRPKIIGEKSFFPRIWFT